MQFNVRGLGDILLVAENENLALWWKSLFSCRLCFLKTRWQICGSKQNGGCQLSSSLD